MPIPPGGRPEDRARLNIDRLLTAAGWLIQDRNSVNIEAGRGIAIREFPLAPGHGFADYLQNRHQRTEAERFRCFSYEDLIKRDKANLDIFWLRDDSLGDSSDLPDPAVLAAEIVEDLQAALDQFAQIAADLGASERESG